MCVCSCRAEKVVKTFGGIENNSYFCNRNNRIKKESKLMTTRR